MMGVLDERQELDNTKKQVKMLWNEININHKDSILDTEVSGGENDRQKDS